MNYKDFLAAMMNELDVVEITAELVVEGHRLLNGSRGVIVHKFNANEFLVEFDQPKCVVGVNSGFLKLVLRHDPIIPEPMVSAADADTKPWTEASASGLLMQAGWRMNYEDFSWSHPSRREPTEVEKSAAQYLIDHWGGGGLWWDGELG